MALFLARHGQRHDYEQKRQGVNWTATAERPWDPPLTAHGEEQGALLGTGAKAHAARLGLPPITRVISSPFLRCLQTSAAAAEALGVAKVAVEPGLAEGLGEDWYRSWAVPGADSTWGGRRIDGPPASAPSAERHEAAMQPSGSLLLDGTAFLGPRFDRDHAPVWPVEKLDSRWDAFESEEALAVRLTAVLKMLHARYPSESILLCSHGGPTALGFQGLTGTPSPVAGYTALYVMLPDGAGRWSAPLAGDTSHLNTDDKNLGLADGKKM